MYHTIVYVDIWHSCFWLFQCAGGLPLHSTKKKAVRKVNVFLENKVLTNDFVDKNAIDDNRHITRVSVDSSTGMGPGIMAKI